MNAIRVGVLGHPLWRFTEECVRNGAPFDRARVGIGITGDTRDASTSAVLVAVEVGGPRVHVIDEADGVPSETHELGRRLAHRNGISLRDVEAWVSDLPRVGRMPRLGFAAMMQGWRQINALTDGSLMTASPVCKQTIAFLRTFDGDRNHRQADYGDALRFVVDQMCGARASRLRVIEGGK